MIHLTTFRRRRDGSYSDSTRIFESWAAFVALDGPYLTNECRIRVSAAGDLVFVEVGL